MGFFDRFRRRGQRGGTPSTSGPSSEAVKDLKDFLASREGIEGFLEPSTAVYALTLLLVAGDGEYTRRPVKSVKQAEKLCEEAGVPLYEARRVGYPQRMKDYERGRPAASVNLEDLPPLEVIEDRDGRNT